ncbi:MAG: hypothetical protein WCT39_00765 [Candidatus Margulisiibacteriota bacterium]
MSKKLIVLAFLLIVFCLLSVSSVCTMDKARPKDINTTAKLDISKIPELKLVAEYKFDSPISDAVFYDNGKPKVVATEAYIRFYNSDGSIRKEIKTRDIKHRNEAGQIVDTRETAQISKNGESVAVMHNLTIGFGWTKYLDRNGKILFEKDFGLGNFWVAPRGDYLVVSDPYETSFIDAHGKIIALYKKLSIDKVVFSRSGDYCLLAGRSESSSKLESLNKQALFLFMDRGTKQIFKCEIPFNIRFISISNSGNYFAVGGNEWNTSKMRILKRPLYVFSQRGRMLAKEDVRPVEFFNDEMILTSSSKNNSLFYLFSLDGEKVEELNLNPFTNSFSFVEDETQIATLENEKIIVYIIRSRGDAKSEKTYNHVVIYNINSGRFTHKKFLDLGGADDPDFIPLGSSISITNYLVIRGNKAIRVFNDFIK